MLRGADKHERGLAVIWFVFGTAGFIIAVLAVYALLYARSSDHALQQPEIPTTTAAGTVPAPAQPVESCPLSGLPAGDGTAAQQRPVLMQIDNAPEARPQAGLNQADIVYEEMAEGSITRYSAIFQCRDAELVGPVRSARPVDIDLVPQYDALLSDSGSNEVITRLMTRAGNVPDISEPAFPAAYRHIQELSPPHDVMTTAAAIRDAAAAAGIDTQSNLSGAPHFKAGTPPPGGPSVTSISVPYSSDADVSFKYDPATNGWLRFIGGEPQRDLLDDTQIIASNVIIQFVNVSIFDSVVDVKGNPVRDFDLTGSGRALVFSDGQLVEGSWLHASASSVTRYADSQGSDIRLNAGQTWVELVPLDFQPSWN